MAVIENACTSPEALAEWRTSMRRMDRAELMAQQFVQHGAEHALAELQKFGVTQENCAAMLANIREGLIEVHAAASERGITLVDYSPPKTSGASREGAPAAPQQCTPQSETVGDEVALVRAVLRGYPHSFARQDALRAVAVIEAALTAAQPAYGKGEKL